MNRAFVYHHAMHRFLKIPGIILGLVTLSVACRPSIDDASPEPTVSVTVAGGGTSTTSTTTTTTSTSSSTSALAISPSTLTLTPSSTYTFGANGGTYPYVYTLVSGVGTIQAGSGLYTAPSTGGTATVKVTDSVGTTSTATITVTSGALAISPTTVNVVLNNSYTFTASGGIPPYTYSVVAGSTNDLQVNVAGVARATAATQGTISASTGVYTAPESSGLKETVRVTDAAGTTSDAIVTVMGFLTSGAYHNCVMINGGAKCWGYNSYGQMGDSSTTTPRSTPVIPGAAAGAALSSGLKSLATGAYHTCASTSSGAVKCWGRNLEGQLGDSSTTQRTSPVSVQGFSSSGATRVIGGTGGESYSTCIITTAGGLQCFGYNNYGNLGDGTATQRTVPVQVSGLTSGVTDAAISYHNAYAVVNGALKAWGFNGNYELGQGGTDTSSRYVPTQVLGLTSGVTQVATGRNYACALMSGSVYCWGYNNSGQLGDGTAGTSRSTPAAVFGLSSIQSIATGSFYDGSTHVCRSCALSSTGVPYCWGYNDSNGPIGLGASDFVSRYSPADLSQFNNSLLTTATVVQVTTSYRHSCVLYNDNRVQCVGYNGNGELGTGNTTNSVGVFANTIGVPW